MENHEFTVSLPKAISLQLLEIAEDDFCTVNDILEEASRDYLEKRAKQQVIEDLKIEVDKLRKEVDHLYNPEMPL